MANDRMVDTRWFKDQLADRKLSMRKVAKQLGRDVASISRMLSGTRHMKIDEASALASLFGVPLKEVLRRCGVDLDHAFGGERVPLVGWVGEGWTVHMGETPGSRFVVAPPYTGTVALRDQSGSLRDGWLMYFKPDRHVRRNAFGRLSIVELEGTGEKLIRVLRPLQGSEEYELIAVDGTSSGSVRVKSASAIVWMKQ